MNEYVRPHKRKTPSGREVRVRGYARGKAPSQAVGVPWQKLEMEFEWGYLYDLVKQAAETADPPVDAENLFESIISRIGADEPGTITNPDVALEQSKKLREARELIGEELLRQQRIGQVIGEQSEAVRQAEEELHKEILRQTGA